jgi:uroporphyrinogen-III synthase
MRVLVTRPQPGAERTAANLRARGCDVLLAPLLSLDIAPDAELGGASFAAVVLTSANAVRAIEHHARRAELISRPVFTVGPRTAEMARAAGFADVHSADGNVRALVRLLAAQPPGALLHLAGEDRAGDLAGDLARHGITVHTAVVYRMISASGLPADVAAALADGALDGVLHFSRRSAQTYLNCARAAEVLDRALTPTHYCLSRQVMAPLADAGAADIRIAARPEQAALIDLVAAG